ncbi:DUF3823 domain-containing protein [Sphingobacterium sp. HMA12]|uniref:DUF3823 domain-containing protein n=1 Tax=Sphingobacterium sp. HMA12 TaxID=2050894 RepID=UPI000CEA152D|nr:DUF3823 domain-containing protein [Sphingobacterium sp. HMA12]
MKTNLIIMGMLIVLGLFSSCEKDNLDYAPNASFSGEIRDLETGELLPQDILEGSKIYFIELGWNNPPVQSMVFKNDGTFRNDLMFAGDYKIILNKGNYVPLDTLLYQMKPGANTQLFEVVPYVRIKDADIKFRDGKVIAKFKMQQNSNNPIKAISLFAHPDISVGYRIQTASVTYELNTNAQDSEYEITMDISNYSQIKTGNSYYFRIGALSSAAEAKYNYSPAINVDL